MSAISSEARRALEWIRDNEHHRGRWLIDGKQVRRQPPKYWTQMELSGPGVNIRIPVAVWTEISGMLVPIGSRERLYALSDAGVAAQKDAVE